MVVFKILGSQQSMCYLFRRWVPVANLRCILPFGCLSRAFGGECHSLTPYALKRVSLYFVLMYYIENSLFYLISAEMSFTVGFGVGYKDLSAFEI